MENHSVHSAPDSRMNRMEGIRFTRNREDTRSFGKFLAGNPTRPLARADIVILRSPPPWVFRFQTERSVLFETEIPCILLFLNRNENG